MYVANLGPCRLRPLIKTITYMAPLGLFIMKWRFDLAFYLLVSVTKLSCESFVCVISCFHSWLHVAIVLSLLQNNYVIGILVIVQHPSPTSMAREPYMQFRHL